MSAPLMVSISGVRGIVGTSLRPDVICQFVSAFGHVQKRHNVEKPVIVLGRDSRVSGPWVEKIVQGVLLAQGYSVLSTGIVPTPTVQLMVLKHKAVGGIIVTSSHNPVQWNGLKFVDNDGLFLSPDMCEKMFALVGEEQQHPGRSKVEFATHNSTSIAPTLKEHDSAIQEHVDAILALPYIDVARVAAKKYTVVLDAINGAGGVCMTKVLETFGCKVIGMNIEPTGIFSHEPEPLPENLSALCERVKAEKADFGIAVDPDVDRCVVIDETGTPIGEEYTLAIAVKFMLGHVGRRGAVVKNLSSSRVLDDIANQYEGCSVHATKVGEIHVAGGMLKHNAVIGGEGNGGVMLPDIHIGRDAPVAAALILQELALSNKTMSQLKASLPQWEIVKLKTPVAGLHADYAIEEITKEWSAKGARVNTEDGVRIDGTDFWVHMRKSNTEPIVRVIGEANTAARAKSICEEFMEKIQSLGKRQ